MTNLYKTRGLYAFLMVVFCNSFVDLGHKILVQNTLYQTQASSEYTIHAAIINGFILLPYIFLFTPSGFIADKFSKARVLRLTALAAIPLTVVIWLCYIMGYFWGAYYCTLLLAIQSAINSPAKYGYLKELTTGSRLAKLNAYVQTLAIIAILAGTFVFTALFSYYIAPLKDTAAAHDTKALLQTFSPLGMILILFSSLEWILTLKLDVNPAADPASTYSPKNYFTGNYLMSYLRIASKSKFVFSSIVGLSIFWSINQVLLATFGAFIKDTMSDGGVMFVQGAMALGGIGIFFGALYAGRVSKGFIELGLVPVATFGISLGLFLLTQLSSKFSICLLFLVYGFFGGMFIVPLNALIQYHAEKKHIGKVLAVNNFIQNVAMITLLILTIVVASLEIPSKFIIYGIAFIATFGCIFTLIKMPESLTRYIIYIVASKFYNVEVEGLDNLPAKGGVLLLGNHVSFVDWAILQISSPRPIRFVMERSIYEKWYLKWLLKKFKIIPISKSSSADSLKTINQALKNGDCVCIFPEGRLSSSGQLGKFHSGFERAAVDSGAVIVPFYLLGLWGSRHSYAPTSFKQSLKLSERKVSVTFGETMAIESKAAEVKSAINQVAITAWINFAKYYESIPRAWLSTAKSDLKQISIKEQTLQLSNLKLIASVWWTKSKLSKVLKDQETCGILLPASIGGVLSNLACLCLGKTTVNLNFSFDIANLKAAVNKGKIKTIISANQFLSRISYTEEELKSLDVQWVYLDELKKQKNSLDLVLRILIVRVLPLTILKPLLTKKAKLNSNASILFSSGSESTPKGICLSNRNVLSNIKQLANVLALEKNDTMLCSLPLFHAFGYTVTTLLPLVQGIPLVCTPDPTNAKAMGQIIARHNVTLMCGTATILGIYTRSKQIPAAYFRSLRIVIAGAEKLSEKTRHEFKAKFECEIYQGYGATELSPVASTNLPDSISRVDLKIHVNHTPTTVGHPLPGTAFRIVDPDTMSELPIGEQGMILVGGPQIMTGYLDDLEKTQQAVIEEGKTRWYITGDKGFIDENGFVTLVDRYSRIAKIGGEMISLQAVENKVDEIIDSKEAEVIVVALDDEKKGQILVMLYTQIENEAALSKILRQSTLPALWQPKHYVKVDTLPQLGSGKKDYKSAKVIAQHSI